MNDSSLVKKHAELLSMIKWDKSNINVPKTRAHACKINQGVLDEDGNLLPLVGNIYVDDILSAGFLQDYILNLLAATIEAIFTVCGEPQTEVRQCPLSLEKWLEMIVGPVQIVLGLSVDTNAMTIGITKEYRKQVQVMLDTNWTSKRKLFQARDMQKSIGKIARLGKGAPWIFKLMSHIYTSLAFALQSNKALLEVSLDKFKLLVLQIRSKQFSGNQADIAKQVNYALKTAAKLVNNSKHMYIINGTMQEELNFIRQALQEDLGINFETPIAFIIPRIPTASLFGDSLLQSCGGYSFKL